MDVLITCCVILSCVLAALLAVCSWFWLTRLRTNAPGPTPLPILGNALYFRKLPVVVEHFRELHRRYGDVYRFYIGPQLAMVVTNPEDFRKLLVGIKSRERDPHVANVLLPYLGNGLVINKGNTWRTHRRLIEPIFHTEALSNSMDIFNDGARFLCDALSETCGSEVDVSKTTIRAVLRIISMSLFGVGLDEVEPDVKKQADFATEFIEGLELMQKRFFQPWLQNKYIMSITADGQAFKRQVNLTNTLIKHALRLSIERRRKGISRKKKNLAEVMFDEDGKRLLSEEEMLDEARTITITGSETSATAIGFALALLGLYSEWQDAIQNELLAVFGTGANYLRPCTNDDCNQLKITDAVIKETLRLFPSVPIASVLAKEDIPLDGGRYVAPRGCSLLAAFFILHRRPELFTDPDKFDPGRFLEGGEALSLPPYSYIPFGAGSRSCVGARFAAIEMKIILAAVLRRFRVLPGSTREELEEVATFITAKSLTGCRVTFVPRDIPT